LVGLVEKIGREARLIRNMAELIGRVGKIKPDSPTTVADILEHWAKVRPQNTAIVFEDKSYTYKELEENASRHARWAQSIGLKRGDAVALLMENRPEFIFAWGGLIKLGVTVALINTNLRERALAHSLTISGAKHLILGAELADNYASAVDDMQEKLTVWATGGSVQGANDLDQTLRSSPRNPCRSASAKA
jgi:fatty-acyl-CoA synthase